MWEEDQHGKPCQKPWNMSSATAWVAPYQLKALAILLDTFIRRSAVDLEDLKPYWKLEKISLGDQQSYYKIFNPNLGGWG